MGTLSMFQWWVAYKIIMALRHYGKYLVLFVEISYFVSMVGKCTYLDFILPFLMIVLKDFASSG